MKRAEITANALNEWAAAEAVSAYLPGNYQVVERRPFPDREGTYIVVIEGEDIAGWTLDDYVLPRLASGLYFGREVEAPRPDRWEDGADWTPKEVT